MLTYNAARPVSDEVPLRFHGATIDEVAVKHLHVAAAIRYATSQRRGLLLRGPVGTGKTFAMVAAARILMPAFPGRGSGFLEWPEFCTDVRRWYGIDTPDRNRIDPMAWVRNHRAPLFIDDVGELGRSADTSHDDGLFAELVRDVYRDGSRLLFATTNLGDEIEERFGERCWSRLQQLCTVVEVLGDDLRTTLHRAPLSISKGSR